MTNRNSGAPGPREAGDMEACDPSPFRWREGRCLPRIARDSVVSALFHRAERPPRFRDGFLGQPGAVFVTLRDAAGQLRGCIGTLRPRCRDVVEETWRMAREAAFHDTRFAPVSAAELGDLRFEVSVLHSLEEVLSPLALDPGVYGVVVSTDDGRRGALLPRVEGIETVEAQLSLARRKGAIGRFEDVHLERFEVDSFREGRDSDIPGWPRDVTKA